ncbi:MAG: type II/IV secretion system ATPase subunit [Candidatus Micrarchaeota archaeon]
MYEYYHEKIGHKMMLNVDCEGGQTSLGSPETLSRVLDILSKEKTDLLSLAGEYKRVYSEGDVNKLKELSSAVQRIKRHAKLQLCEKCAKKGAENRIKEVYSGFDSDPINSYFIALELLKGKISGFKQSGGCAECGSGQQEFLQLVTEELGSTQVIKEAAKTGAGKEAYHKIFNPSMLPSFITSVITFNVPADATKIESYKVGNAAVSIYALPDRPEKLYFIDAPEFSIHENENKLLGEALEIITKEESRIVNPADARRHFKSIAEEVLYRHRKELTPDESQKMSDIIARYSAGYGILEIMLNDKRLQDVYVDSPGGNNVYVFHEDYEECITNVTLTNLDLEKLAARFRAISGRPFDESSPVLHAELTDLGVRICGVMSPATFGGTGFAFRRHKQIPWTLPQFVKAGMLDSKTAGLISFLVDGQRSILITGPRSSGKTSFLTAMIAESSVNYRVVAIEDTPELPVQVFKENGYKIQHLRTKSTLGTEAEVGYELSATDALRTALRLGESTLVLGEVRGPEAKALFEAMRIGAAGNVVMGTIHGSSAYDTWDRIVNDLGVPSTSFKAADIVISLASIRKSDELKRYRRLISITEVRKDWKEDPARENGFKDLAVYEERANTWKIDLKDSEIIDQITKLKAMTSADAKKNIECRGQIIKELVEASEKTGRPELLEIKTIQEMNNHYLILIGKYAAEGRKANYQTVLRDMQKWIKERAL